MNKNKLSSIAGKLDRFVKLLQVLAVFCCVLLVFGVLILLIRVPLSVDPSLLTGIDPEDIHLFNVRFVRFNFGMNFSTARDHLRYYFVLYLLFTGVGLAAILTGLTYIRRIFDPMTKGEPFHADTARLFRKLANAALVFGIAHNAAEAVEAPATVFLIADAPALPASLHVTWSPDFTFLLVYALLLLMSYIFSYGRELQTLADETL